MDINKIKNLLGLGDDDPEDLETAMEKQILPDLKHEPVDPGLAPFESGDIPPYHEPDPSSDDLSEAPHLMKVGRCPSCGDLIMDKAEQLCAWCNTTCRPEQDGFHLVHVALGTFQERHCFCSDDCFEAFRRMYPARVHRNCYERPCADCNYCVKRYTDEFDGLPGQEQEPRPRDAAPPEKA